MTPVLLYLPEPIGWVALTPEALHEAQERARPLIGTPNTSHEAASRAQRAELVDAEALARVLSVDVSWVLRSARRREIPVIKVGKYVRFSVEDVIAARQKEVRT